MWVQRYTVMSVFWDYAKESVVCFCSVEWLFTCLSCKAGYTDRWQSRQETLQVCMAICKVYSGAECTTVCVWMPASFSSFPLNLNKWISRTQTQSNKFWIIHHRFSDKALHMPLFAFMLVCVFLICAWVWARYCSHIYVPWDSLATSSSHIKLHLSTQGKYAAGLTNISKI